MPFIMPVLCNGAGRILGSLGQQGTGETVTSALLIQMSLKAYDSPLLYTLDNCQGTPAIYTGCTDNIMCIEAAGFLLSVKAKLKRLDFNMLEPLFPWR